MKKALKIFAIVCAAAVAVLVLASVALRLLLPPEKAKALVLKQLKTHLKRDVQMGNVSVGVLSGLSVSDLKISESPDFSRGTFISSDHFSIRLAVLPLIFRKIEVKQLILNHPVIQIVRYPDGKTFNFSDLMASTTTARAPKTARGSGGVPYAYADSPPTASPKPTEPSFSLVVSQAQIQKGVLHFLDRSPAKQSVDIDSLDLKLKNVSLTSPFTVQASLKAKARGILAALKLAGEADLATGSFKIKNCELSSGGSTLSLAGNASQLKSNRPTVDLGLDVKEFKLSTLAPFLALPPGLKVEGPILATARLKGDQKKMDYTVQADLEKVQIVYAKQFSKPPRVPLRLSLRGHLADLQNLNLAELKVLLGSLQLAGHGNVIAINSSQPQIGMHLESNSFPVAEWLDFAPGAFPPGLVLKGRAQFSADLSGTQASSHIAAKCDGKELEVAWGDKFNKPAGTALRLSVVGERIQSTARPAGQIMNFQTIAAAVDALEMNGSGSVTTGASAPKFQLTFKSNSFSLQMLSKRVPMLGPYRLGGTAAMNVRASGTADAPLANGALTLQDASLHYQQSDLTRIATALTFTHQDVSIPKLTGKLNGSDIVLKLTGRRLTTQPDVTVDANIVEVDLAKLLPPAATSALPASLLVPLAWAAAPPAATPPMKLAGHLAIGHVKHEFYDAQNLDLKWALTDVTPSLERINGTAVLKQGPGKLSEVEKLTASSAGARIAFGVIATLQKLGRSGLLRGLGIPSLDTIHFDSIFGDYVFRSGVLDIKTFETRGRDLNIATAGTIGLAGAQPLDMRVTLKLPPGKVRESLGQFVVDEAGRLSLAFTAKGTVAAPEVKLDTREVGRKAIEKIGGQLLKGLGVGKQAPASPAPDNTQQAPSDQQPPPPSSSQPNAAKELEKVFKNIFR